MVSIMKLNAKMLIYFHSSDYSENMSQKNKYEPQSAHFNRKSYSLHCMVKYMREKEFDYIFHLSDDLVHDASHTLAARRHQLTCQELPKIIREKSDNCSKQYICKWVFGECAAMAVEYNRTVLLYFSEQGHGKGLWDASGSFGVKSPVSNAVLKENFKYNCAVDICTFLKDRFQAKPNRHYFVLEQDYIIKLRQKKTSISIDSCRSQHMIAFHPDERIVIKQNICSCPDCLIGEFTKCVFEAGKLIQGQEANSSDDSEVDESECDDFVESDDDDEEQYEMRSSTVLDVLKKNTVISIFSPENALELFFLCRVTSFGTADSELRDGNGHIIPQGKT